MSQYEGFHHSTCSAIAKHYTNIIFGLVPGILCCIFAHFVQILYNSGHQAQLAKHWQSVMLVQQMEH